MLTWTRMCIAWFFIKSAANTIDSYIHWFLNCVIAKSGSESCTIATFFRTVAPFWPWGPVYNGRFYRWINDPSFPCKIFKLFYLLHTEDNNDLGVKLSYDLHRSRSGGSPRILPVLFLSAKSYASQYVATSIASMQDPLHECMNTHVANVFYTRILFSPALAMSEHSILQCITVGAIRPNILQEIQMQTSNPAANVSW